MTLRLQPVQVATGSNDQESQLVFHEGLLVAILVRLSDLHETNAGKWFLEAGFGPVTDISGPMFSDIDEAQAWICARLGLPDA